MECGWDVQVAAVEKAGFLFPSRHELQTATWLGAGLSLLPLLHAGIFFSRLDLVQVYAHRHCEFIHVSVLLGLEDTVFMWAPGTELGYFSFQFTFLGISKFCPVLTPMVWNFLPMPISYVIRLHTFTPLWRSPWQWFMLEALAISWTDWQILLPDSQLWVVLLSCLGEPILNYMTLCSLPLLICSLPLRKITCWLIYPFTNLTSIQEVSPWDQNLNFSHRW